jgi:hypothetical protein
MTTATYQRKYSDADINRLIRPYLLRKQQEQKVRTRKHVVLLALAAAWIAISLTFIAFLLIK